MAAPIGGIGVVWCPGCGPIYAAANVKGAEPISPHSITHSIDSAQPRIGVTDDILCPRCRRRLETPGCIRWLTPVLFTERRPTGPRGARRR